MSLIFTEFIHFQTNDTFFSCVVSLPHFLLRSCKAFALEERYPSEARNSRTSPNSAKKRVETICENHLDGENR